MAASRLEGSGLDPEGPTPQLELKQVSVLSELGTQVLLNDVSCRIFAGDRVGVVGPSGAGKTTFLRLLNRLSDPSTGVIYGHGQPLTEVPVLSWRRQTMLVLQEPKLLGMTVKQALIYPLRLQKLPEATMTERLHIWMQRFAIPEDWLARTEVQLSLGQRQLVSLARACLAEPKILLLDEPTSALDVGRVERVLQILRALPSTVVIVSHQLTLLEDFCDRIFWLDHGKLRADQATTDLDWAALRTTLQQQAQTLEDDDWD